jgi:hypothetical protein
MSIILLLVAGVLSSVEAGDAPSFEPGASCIDALHHLRAEERLDIVSTDVLEDNVLAFTLSDGPRRGEKTAILICQHEVAADDDGAETGDLPPEIIEPGVDTGDDTGDPTGDEIIDETETVVE